MIIIAELNPKLKPHENNIEISPNIINSMISTTIINMWDLN
jgi:hypothetical protein